MRSDIHFLAVLILSALLCSCKNDQIACTEEFRFITIEVKGGQLDGHYTIREKNGDTIRPFDQGFPNKQSYVVLDDNYSDELRNDEEDFRFEGLIGSEIVVSEDFVIGADECHIYYVSGKQVVNIE